MDSIKLDFSRSAHSYDNNAHIQAEVSERLLARLDFLNISPKNILDLGAGTGACGKILQAKYPNANIINLDFSYSMCEIAKKSNPMTICADINHLPIRKNSIDLIVSNFTLQWCEDLERVFSDILKIARPEALFLFSTVGFDSLNELRNSWLAVDSQPRVNQFLDLQTIGNYLFQAGWQTPVMDIDKITRFYDAVPKILKEFKGLGVTNKIATRQKGLTGKAKFQQFIKNYENLKTPEGIPLSWEIVYGYAQAPKGVQFNFIY